MEKHNKTFEDIFNIAEHVKSQLDSPNWKKCEKVHDWKNYVSEDIRKIWNTMSQNERQIIAHFASIHAENEEWD